MADPVLRNLLLTLVEKGEKAQGRQGVRLGDILPQLMAVVDPARAVQIRQGNWGEGREEPPPLDVQIRSGARHLVNLCCHNAKRSGVLRYAPRKNIENNILYTTPKGRATLRALNSKEKKK